MNEINQLEAELEMMLDNIDRVREFKSNNENEKYTPYQSHVFGELKHRSIALKNTLTRIQKLSTSHLFKK